MDGTPPHPYIALAQTLESADEGNIHLSTLVFLALGGVIRREPISKQGGEMVDFPYWPTEADPCVGTAFTTNLGDIAHLYKSRGWDWSILVEEGLCSAKIIDDTNPIITHARTASLVMSAAAVRYVYATEHSCHATPNGVASKEK